MTKTDYALIARALYDSKPINMAYTSKQEFAASLKTWTLILSSLVIELKQDNPCFDPAPFVIACERGERKTS
jgi:hypothetical protein